MKENIFVVIMAGGIGIRFWPHSRNDHPKQFLDLLGTGKSLLRMTFERFLDFCPPENFLVVTHEAYVPLVKEHIPEIGKDQILTEPVRRNTAPCIAYASQKLKKRHPDAMMVVTPADHMVTNKSKFSAGIRRAIRNAKVTDRLFTIGIEPTRPETGYGYIQFHKPEGKYYKVKTFTEKPQLELAKKFIETGEFLWNTGIFIWNVDSILKAFQSHLPEVAEVFADLDDVFYTRKEKDAIRRAYSHCRNISIDYGIMEKADNVYVIPADFGWSDLGNWESLYEIKSKDKDKNVIDGKAAVYDTTNCLIKTTTDGKLIVVEGLEGYLVGEFDDVIIVVKKDNEKRFRQFTRDLRAKKKGRDYL